MDSEYKFRTSLIGFCRSDVIEYIKWLSNEFFLYRRDSEATVASLNERIISLEAQLAEKKNEDLNLIDFKDDENDEDELLSKRLDSFFDKMNNMTSEFNIRNDVDDIKPVAPASNDNSKGKKKNDLPDFKFDITDKEELVDDFDEQFIKELKEILHGF